MEMPMANFVHRRYQCGRFLRNFHATQPNDFGLSSGRTGRIWHNWPVDCCERNVRFGCLWLYSRQMASFQVGQITGNHLLLHSGPPHWSFICSPLLEWYCSRHCWPHPQFGSFSFLPSFLGSYNLAKAFIPFSVSS